MSATASRAFPVYSLEMHAYPKTLLCGAVVCLATLGCAEATTVGRPSGDGEQQDPSSVPEAIGVEYQDGTQELCDCPDDQPDGTRHCIAGYWDICPCAAADVSVASDCKPGRYEGEFFGYYFSSFAGAFSP